MRRLTKTRSSVQERKCVLFRVKMFTMVVSLLGSQLVLINNIHAATIDDLRELLGQPRLDHEFTTKQKQDITSKYLAIHQHNQEAELLKASDPASLNAKYKAEYAVDTKLISTESAKLKSDFSTGVFVNTVLKENAKLSLLYNERSDVPQQRSPNLLKIENNPYTKDYNKIQTITKTIKGYVNLGHVGNLLESPVDNQFILSLPYGNIKDFHTGRTTYNNGLNLAAPSGSKVISIWNGTVYRVTHSSNGYTVEVSDGNGVVTYYGHLGKVIVSKGQKLHFYDELGLLGKSSGSTSYLHFEVGMGSKLVNPIFFFGQKGRQALQNYIYSSRNPSIQKMQSTVFKIKNQTSEQAKAQAKTTKNSKYYGREPVNYDQSNNPPKGSTKLHLKSGYTMPDPVGPISGLGRIKLNERH